MTSGAGPGAAWAGGGADGLCLVVDTAAVDEAEARADRVRQAVLDAAEGLDRLPVAGVVVGADPLLDALADLGRQWRAGLDASAREAQDLAGALREARTAYATVEREAVLAAQDLRDGVPGPRTGR
ncbi:hypothetical protein [Aquipuribacter hungaricus]|uniref:Excreted virulence factor EspC (Type VII ESX diderm) n=1 Tax=Aquipuribacter hungaricus TaxID=545624 RepID=A0ABV7WG01_9MICO